MEKPEEILDIGSGTGYCANKLSTQFSTSEITSLDIAFDMLSFAKKSILQKGGECQRQQWLCGDAEELPFSDNSFDLVVSNLAIQWCENPQQVFKELFRVMKPGAQAWVSTLAEQTLVELKESWARVDTCVHVNNFLSFENIVQLLEDRPFSGKNYVHEQQTYFYESLVALANELKGIGAHNQNSGQPTGLTGKRKLKQLKQDFERKYITGKGISVTYDLVLLHLIK